MTDSPILTPEQFQSRLADVRRQGFGGPVTGRPRQTLLAHDAALRAALAAAEKEVERQKALMLRQTTLTTEAIMQRIAAEERAAGLAEALRDRTQDVWRAEAEMRRHMERADESTRSRVAVRGRC